MTINTDKIDAWVYAVIAIPFFIFVLLPSAWKRIKEAKGSLKEMLDIHNIDSKVDKINEEIRTLNLKVDSVDKKLNSFVRLEEKILEIVSKVNK